MKDRDFKVIITAALFYGSLWGIAEAVFGYLLHMLPFGVSAFIMFPIGFFFMERGWRHTQKAGTALYIGIVAAVVKLADLFLPFLPVIKTVSPAVSIIIEALAVTAGISLFAREGRLAAFPVSAFVSISWRIIYTCYAFVLTLFLIPTDVFKNGLQSVIKFIVMNGAINAVIIYAYLKLSEVLKAPLSVTRIKIGPLVSVCVFAAAIFSSILFSIL